MRKVYKQHTTWQVWKLNPIAATVFLQVNVHILGFRQILAVTVLGFNFTRWPYRCIKCLAGEIIVRLA